MNLQEAYLTLHKASGIEAGDEVKILRMPKDGNELGWGFKPGFSDTPARFRAIGTIQVVTGVNREGSFSTPAPGSGSCWDWPFFCLELIKKGKPPIPPINIGDNVVEFTDKGIKVGCQEVSKETVDAIHKRLQ